ncbi:RraA family protein [Lacrimispora sp. NSJ-141]|uniref:RraA family protein n=1 Tax=Lientehia hominis TaxID=2897778 RepID=A0AAP2RK74_9FIRM|nr:RraA family protein [Lientehia hominis]MCD2492979.1 RraA family protein [Lientehia hominis]
MGAHYLSHADILELRRFNTPTIYNGWEAVAERDRLECNCSWGEITDFTPQMGPMTGFAVTVEYVCGDKAERLSRKNPFGDLYEYLAGIPGPKILIAKDLEAPDSKGSIFGEVTGNAYRALGCSGGITDGYVRDVDEGAYGGFKMLAKRLGVGHAYSCPVRFGTAVEMYGTVIEPGMFVHADKYGFIAIPDEETKYLLEAVRGLDGAECKTTIPTGREAGGKSFAQVAKELAEASAEQARISEEFIRKLKSGR